MDYLIIFLITLKTHPIISFLCIIILGIIAPFFLPKKVKLALFCGGFILFSLCFVTVFMGHYLTNYLIDKFGDSGQGTIVNIVQTPYSFNDESILRYNVMINSNNDNDKVSTYCLTSDFNITYRNSINKSFSPQPGAKLNVKFIKNYPRAFIIIADNDEIRPRDNSLGLTFLYYQRTHAPYEFT